MSRFNNKYQYLIKILLRKQIVIAIFDGIISVP
jgi:hypothetical protein